MNKRKLLILSVLAIFVVAMSLSAVSASKTKTKTIKIRKQMQYKNLDKIDGISVVYQTYNAQYDSGLTVEGASYGGSNLAQHTKLIKAKAYYKKNSKTFKKVKKSKDGGYTVHFKLNGYTPYKVKVYYKKK